MCSQSPYKKLIFSLESASVNYKEEFSMKRWIHASSEISAEILWKAQEFARRFKGAKVDLENNEIVIPFDKNATE